LLGISYILRFPNKYRKGLPLADWEMDAFAGTVRPLVILVFQGTMVVFDKIISKTGGYIKCDAITCHAELYFIPGLHPSGN
jgi:hypothetical protein